MVRLSVNLNKIALLRNSRHSGVPNVTEFAGLALAARADGITLHPRPDARHIRRSDVVEIAALMAPHRPAVELNLEGYPGEAFLDLVAQVRPEQCTLVPDAPDTFTSESGWILDTANVSLLQPVIRSLKGMGIRVCLFMDPDPALVAGVPSVGADGIEVYTGAYAAAFATGDEVGARRACHETAARAHVLGLVVNAGHDLNLANLPPLTNMPGLREVSIGHELTHDALIYGFQSAVLLYRQALGWRADEKTPQAGATGAKARSR